MGYTVKVAEGDVDEITKRVMKEFELLNEEEKIKVRSAELVAAEMRKFYNLPPNFDYLTIGATPGTWLVISKVHQLVDEEMELYFREQ